MINNSGENYGLQANKVYGPVSIYTNNPKDKKIPSLLPKLIEVLANLDFDSDFSDINNSKENRKPYTIQEKLNHNEVILYEEIIKRYYGYFHVCESALTTLESFKYGTKKKILTDIKTLYEEVKRRVVSQYLKQRKLGQSIDVLKIVQFHSDEIIDEVKSILKQKIEDTYNSEDFTLEDLPFCLDVFLVYAFGECKILEKPGLKNASN